MTYRLILEIDVAIPFSVAQSHTAQYLTDIIVKQWSNMDHPRLIVKLDEMLVPLFIEKIIGSGEVVPDEEEGGT